MKIICSGFHLVCSSVIWALHEEKMVLSKCGTDPKFNSGLNLTTPPGNSDHGLIYVLLNLHKKNGESQEMAALKYLPNLLDVPSNPISEVLLTWQVLHMLLTISISFFHFTYFFKHLPLFKSQYYSKLLGDLSFKQGKPDTLSLHWHYGINHTFFRKLTLGLQGLE